MSARLTFHLMLFLWTWLAVTGLLVQYVESQPHTVIFEGGTA